MIYTNTYTYTYTYTHTHTHTLTHTQESRTAPIGEELTDVNSDTSSLSGKKVKLVFKITLLAESTYILPMHFMCVYTCN